MQRRNTLKYNKSKYFVSINCWSLEYKHRKIIFNYENTQVNKFCYYESTVASKNI